jgi:hypothetical protein
VATGVGKRRGQLAWTRGAAEVLPLGLGSEGAQDFLLDFPSIYVWLAFLLTFPGIDERFALIINWHWRLMKLWKATISALLPPENPCGGLTPLTVAEILHSLPKGCIETLPIPFLRVRGKPFAAMVFIS